MATTYGEVPVEQVLAGAHCCTVVLVIGETEDGAFYVASSTGDTEKILGFINELDCRLADGYYDTEEIAPEDTPAQS